MRTISLNADYILLMRNQRDKSVALHLGRQLIPNAPTIFVEIFSDATKLPYSYLRIDNTSTCPDHLRFLTNLESNPFEPIAYVLEDEGA